ncbi:MAG: adenylate/guanylate cyclase domain-containing protein [Pseudomonadota bacterium]
MAARAGLNFADPAVEARFVAYYITKSLPVTRLFLVVGAISYYGFFISDKIMDPVGGEIAHMIRGFAVAPVFALAALMLSTNIGRRYQEALVTTIYMLAQLGLTLVYSVIAHGYDYAAMGFVILLMAANAAFALRTPYIALISVFALVTTIVGHLLADNARPQWIIINILALLTSITFSSVAAYLRERVARRQFLTEEALSLARARVNDLLHSMLPSYVVQRIQSGETGIADSLGEVAVIFASVGNVADPSQGIGEAQLLRGLNLLFSNFDREAERYGIDKIKTIGGSYMAVSGLAGQRVGEDHVENAADFALALQAIVARVVDDTGYPVNLRIGMHVGPVVAGVIGVQRPVFDCWGESVNLAARLESKAPLREILVSESTYWRLKQKFDVTFFADVTLKGIGRAKSYCLRGRHADSAETPINKLEMSIHG